MAFNVVNSSLEQKGPTGVITGSILKFVMSNDTGRLVHPFGLIAITSTAFGMKPAGNPDQSTIIELVPCPTATHLFGILLPNV